MSAKGTLAQYIEEYADDPEFVAEGLALDLMEKALQLMEEQSISRADLARRMGVSRSAISQLFGKGSKNLTLLTMTRLASAVGGDLVCALEERVSREHPGPHLFPNHFDFEFDRFVSADAKEQIEEPTEVASAA